jgi:glycogen synthase
VNIAFLTNEYPPHIYGGAGVHVEYLTRELAKLGGGAHSVRVLCFGDQQQQSPNLSVQGIQAEADLPFQDPRHERFFSTLLQGLAMSGTLTDIDLVHCHTWYSHFGGCLTRVLLGVPMVLTTHSLEPHRPWKAEQLGTAYAASTWIERTAYQNADGVIAVSESMRQDVQSLYGVAHDRIRVIHNGIDLNQYRPTPSPQTLAELGIRADVPFVLFVGRITKQKGILHLVNAIRSFRAGVQVVLCAGAPDTPEIGRDMAEAVAAARAATRNDIIWIAEMLPREKTIALYTHAAVFVCPSVYEPFGIINLEAMACETPVVASAVGGIPEVVEHGETGLLVPAETVDHSEVEPRHPQQFARDLAAAVNTLLDDADLRAAMGRRARERVEQHFSWTSIARQTLDFYQEVIAKHDARRQGGHRQA